MKRLVLCLALLCGACSHTRYDVVNEQSFHRADSTPEQKTQDGAACRMEGLKYATGWNGKSYATRYNGLFKACMESKGYQLVPVPKQ